MQGQELRNVRRQLGWTQAQLAGALGLTETYVGLMERGVHAIEKRTELATLHLLANEEAADLYDGEPMSEARNMVKAISDAREAVQFYRKSRESIPSIYYPSLHLSIEQLAEELTKMITEFDQYRAAEKKRAR